MNSRAHTATSGGGARYSSAKGRARHDAVLTAAAALFTEIGFARTTSAAVAQAAGLTPSGIYRYFGTKDDLLVAVVDRAAGVYLDAVAGSDPGQIARTALAVTARDPVTATIVLRESHYLPDGADSPKLALLEEIWSKSLRRTDASPESSRFLVTAALGVLAGAARRRLTPRARDRLVDLMTGLARAECTDDPATPAPRPDSDLDSRREVTLRAAVRLFRRRGFDAVGVDDIGAEAGVTGAAVYRHFRNKHDLLVTAFRRTGDRFVTAASAALTNPADTPRDTLGHLVRAYIDIAFLDRDLLFVYIHEAPALPPVERREMAAIQDALIKIWIDVTLLVDPSLTRADARTLCLGVIGALNACAVDHTGTVARTKVVGIATVRTLGEKSGAP